MAAPKRLHSLQLYVRVVHQSWPTPRVGLWCGHWLVSNRQWVEPSLDWQVLHALRRRPNAHLCKEGSKTGRREEKKPLCCGDSERASSSGCLYFVRVWFLSRSLSVSPTLPSFSQSSEGTGSSKDTLVDSRKSGCCRSIRNLVGVSVWVEPAEEQRWLHARVIMKQSIPIFLFCHLSVILKKNRGVKKLFQCIYFS